MFVHAELFSIAYRGAAPGAMPLSDVKLDFTCLSRLDGPHALTFLYFTTSIIVRPYAATHMARLVSCPLTRRRGRRRPLEAGKASAALCRPFGHCASHAGNLADSLPAEPIGEGLLTHILPKVPLVILRRRATPTLQVHRPNDNNPSSPIAR